MEVSTKMIEFLPKRAALTSDFISQQRVALENKITEITDQAKEELEENHYLSRQTENEQNRRLTPLYRALREIPEGKYGICKHCGLTIEEDRLIKTPEAEICRTCIQAEKKH